MARSTGGRAKGTAGSRSVTVVVVDTAVALAGDEGDVVRLRHRLRAVRGEADAHGGALVRVCGHGAVVCFVGPACALRFAAAVRDRLADDGPGARIGVHAASTETSPLATTPFAATTGLAARLAVVAVRLAEAAAPGEVLASTAVAAAGIAPDGWRLADGGEMAALLTRPREGRPALAASA